MAQILHFLRANSIHVMAITESWLGKSIGNNSIELPGFQAPFRRDRHENGGGVYLYISKKTLLANVGKTWSKNLLS